MSEKNEDIEQQTQTSIAPTPVPEKTDGEGDNIVPDDDKTEQTAIDDGDDPKPEQDEVPRGSLL